MDINISKKDVLWGYFATFFSIGTGLITLPLILNKLSAEEVGMNYLMLSVSSFISLLECNFAGLIGRNITYVFSGAQTLEKEGIEGMRGGKVINYHLLATIIDTARFIYCRISFLIFFVMITAGSVYMWNVTNGFINVDNSLTIWLFYSISVYFNIYYMYYNSLLVGAARIMEQKKAMVYSKIVYILICYVMLFRGWGLMSVVIANLISPFVSRFYSWRKFYTPEIKRNLKGQIVEKTEMHRTFKVLWFSARKLMVNSVGSYLCIHAGMFIAGLFLSLSEVGSYGLMLQLFSILSSLAANLVSAYEPLFCKLRVQGDMENLRKKFSLSLFVMYVVFFVGGIFIILAGDWLLTIVRSKSVLPATYIMVFFFINQILTTNHSYCAVFIATGNHIPFVKASVVAGVFIVAFSLLFLYFTNWGVFSLVFAQLMVHIAYNHWRWPLWVMHELDFTFIQFLTTGYREAQNMVHRLLIKVI